MFEFIGAYLSRINGVYSCRVFSQVSHSKVSRTGWSNTRRIKNLKSKNKIKVIKIGVPVKSTQIFSGCSPDFIFLIYKYDNQLFSVCPAEKNLGRFYRVPFKSILRVQIKQANVF